jgi:6-pyruvoyltetrahydropterin/6-carboxytetrahydropterin synthase
MYRLSVRRDFKARHYLVGGDWGEENRPHSHDYRVEWEITGADLDRHGFLVDLVDVERTMDEALSRFNGALLNELEEFSGANPSLERFARILWTRLSAGVHHTPGLASLVRLWENDQAWASFEPG